ncbi:MAG TPA: PIG-L family deacetylase, partial [Blastocatellia bacterium]|nr:PIG-L family deacetylase [Blastocatellia bacterium]
VETVGAGALLKRLPTAAIVHVTDGAPRNMTDAIAAGFHTREDYSQARRAEAVAALHLAGISPDQEQSLDFVDQEASLDLVRLSRKLAEILDQLKPEVVLTHPYEGGHPDHDATAFALHAACRLLRRCKKSSPKIVEFTCYHNRNGSIEVEEFLPSENSEIKTTKLSESERDFKLKMIQCYTTQRETLRVFPIVFERFRLAPKYDFTVPPHDGRLLYELFDWGMTGAHWRSLAKQALEQLDLTN